MHEPAAAQALTDPSRRVIAEESGNGDRPAAELTRKPRISQPAVPRHLRPLRQAGPGRQPAPRGRATCAGFAATAPSVAACKSSSPAPPPATAEGPSDRIRHVAAASPAGSSCPASPPARPSVTKPVTTRSPARMPRRRRPRRPASAPSAPNRPFCATRPQPARRGHSAQTRRSGHPRSGEPLRCVTIDCRGLRTRSPWLHCLVHCWLAVIEAPERSVCADAPNGVLQRCTRLAADIRIRRATGLWVAAGVGRRSPRRRTTCPRRRQGMNGPAAMRGGRCRAFDGSRCLPFFLCSFYVLSR